MQWELSLINCLLFMILHTSWCNQSSKIQVWKRWSQCSVTLTCILSRGQQEWLHWFAQKSQNNFLCPLVAVCTKGHKFSFHHISKRNEPNYKLRKKLFDNIQRGWCNDWQLWQLLSNLHQVAERLLPDYCTDSGFKWQTQARWQLPETTFFLASFIHSSRKWGILSILIESLMYWAQQAHW